MNETALIKALLINAAACNAIAVCENTTGTLPAIDPLIQDTNLQGKGVMVYEEAKIQYAALLRAFQDKTGIWPDPQLPAAAASAAGSAPPATALINGVLGVLNQLPPTTAITSVGSLITAISGLVKASPAAPGSDIPQQPAAK